MASPAAIAMMLQKVKGCGGTRESQGGRIHATENRKTTHPRTAKNRCFSVLTFNGGKGIVSALPGFVGGCGTVSYQAA
jgi:hypothetical protein